MYTRSHIDYVSGVRKYIYLDGNNKKYIKDKNKYYPIKKYKGVYSQKNIRGGASKTIDNVALQIYDIIDKTDDTPPYIEFNINIDVSDYIDDDNDSTYKSILNDDKLIYVFNKNSQNITDVLTKLKAVPGMNHFIIVKKKQSLNIYINKKNLYLYSFVSNIERFSAFYNIIYKRNNKINKYSDDTIEDILTIFSITDDDISEGGLKDYIKNNYDIIEDNDVEYRALYKSTFDKLNELYL
jgi:hypothetical protein